MRAWFRVSAVETGTNCCPSPLRTRAGQLQPCPCSPDCARRAASGALPTPGTLRRLPGPLVPLLGRKSSRFARSPRQGGCVVPSTPWQPGKEIPRPRDVPVLRGSGPGAVRGRSGSAARPGPERRAEIQDRARSQLPADTHGPCFGDFSRGQRLGRAPLLAPAGRSIAPPGASETAAFRAGCPGLGDVSVT